MDPAQVSAILDTLSKEDWDFVQVGVGSHQSILAGDRRERAPHYGQHAGAS
jgi:uncharacterized protein (UPF0212 family)